MSAVKRFFFDNWGPTGRGLIVGFALLAVISGTGIGTCVRHVDVTSCRNRAALMHREYRSELVGGCLVRLDDGTFIPIGNLRANDVERQR